MSLPSLQSWVRWTRNDAGLLSAWYALAADRAGVLCGVPFAPARVHREMLVPPGEAIAGAVCRVCLARARKAGEP